jgi:hypothetical protein
MEHVSPMNDSLFWNIIFAVRHTACFCNNSESKKKSKLKYLRTVVLWCNSILLIPVREKTFSRYCPAVFQVQLSPLHLLRPGPRRRRRHRHRGQQLAALLFQSQFAGGRRRRPADDGRLRPVRLWRPDYRRSKSRALPLGGRLPAARAGKLPNDGGRRRSRDLIGGGRRPWWPSSGRRHSARRPFHEARAEQSRLAPPQRPSPSRKGLKLDTTCCCCCVRGEMRKTTTFHDVVVFC